MKKTKVEVGRFGLKLFFGEIEPQRETENFAPQIHAQTIGGTTVGNQSKLHANRICILPPLLILA